MYRVFPTMVILFLSLEMLTLPGVTLAQDKHCLWQIKTSSNTIYILGSIHLMKENHYPLAPALEDAFIGVDHIVTEVDIDSLAMPGIAQTIAMMGLYTDGSTLSDKISDKAHGIVKQAAEELGFSPAMLNHFRPWFVALTLTTLKLQKLGFRPEYGIDRYFHSKAKIKNKGRHALETIQFQTALLSKMSESMQEEMLVQTLTDLKTEDTYFDDLYQGWLKGNTTKMDALLSDNYKDFPAIYKYMIVDRNKDWVPKIEQFMGSNDNYLVIVGAGHLVGKDSVIDLLRSRGYNVEQL